MTLLYAIGIGALVNVAVAILGRLLRLANVRFDPSGESLVVGRRGGDHRRHVSASPRARELVRLALLGLAAHAALLINRFLGVAFNGRTPGDGSIDAFQFTPVALTLLVGGFVLGIAVGLIFRGFRPQLPSWRPPERLVRAAGLAYVVGTIAGLVWPAPFLAQMFGDTDLVTAVLSLPLILAGPLVAGAYASRAGVDYRSIALLGAYMTLPDHHHARCGHRMRASARSATRGSKAWRDSSAGRSSCRGSSWHCVSLGGRWAPRSLRDSSHRPRPRDGAGPLADTSTIL